MKTNYYLATFLGTTTVALVSQSSIGQQINLYQQVRQSVVIIQNTAGVRQGTGFIVSKDNNIYSVLTASYIVRNGQFQIRTDAGSDPRKDDSETRPVAAVFPLPGVDLALVQFSSTRSYPVARLANSADSIQPTSQIFVLGYPSNGAGAPEIPGGNVTSRQSTGNGLSISHNVETKPGMGGSPVLNESGEVVGIHIGLADSAGFREALPIEQYRQIAPAVFAQTSRADLAAGNFNSIITNIEQGRRLSGQETPEASLLLAYAYFGLGNLDRAREEARKISNISSEAVLLLGAIEYLQGNFSSAIQNSNRAIDLDRRNLGSYASAILGLSYASISPVNAPEANQNASNALNLLPNDRFVYFARSCVKYRLSGDIEGVRSDLNNLDRLEEKPANPFLAVLSTRLQQSTRTCLPEQIAPSIGTNPRPTAGRYKPRQPITLDDGATTLAISRDSRLVAVGLRNGTVSIHDVQTGKKIASLSSGQSSSVIGSVAFSPDGRDLAIASFSGSVTVFNIQGETAKYSLDAGGNPSIVFSNNNRLLYVGSSSGTLRMVDNLSGQILVADANAHPRGINSLVLSPDGRFVVSGGGDGVVRLWSSSDLTPVDNYRSHEREVQSLAFSADGSQIISTDFDVVKSCNWQTKQCTDVGRSRQIIRGLAVATNGQMAYSADNQIFLEDLKNKISLGTLSGHRDQVDALAYTPDGRFLISGSNDRTMIIWEVQ